MHYPDTALPVNNTAGDAPLIVFGHKRAEEAHITVSEVRGRGEGGGKYGRIDSNGVVQISY